MRTILFKVDEIYTLMVGDKMIASTDSDFQTDYEIGKLSKKNCDEIFGVVDVDKLGQKHYEVHIKRGHTQEDSLQRKIDFIIGFNKSNELNKDKLFGVKEVVELCKILLSNPFEKCGKTYQELTDNYIQSLQQPTEIEVEVEQVLVQSSIEGEVIWKYKLDNNGCLILKKL
jgi:hypothetical protein